MTPLALFAETYTWSGASGADWATETNWSPSGTPASADTIRFENDSAVSVGGTVPLAVTNIVNAGAGTITFDCPVQFADTYLVEKNGAVKFPGCATATTWNGANASVAPTAEFRGNVTFLEDWTVPSANGSRIYIRNGATVTCQTLILPKRGSGYLDLVLLQVDAGGTLDCRQVQQRGSTYYYNGVGHGVTVYINGRLNVAEDYEVLQSGRIGINKVGGAIEYYGNGLFCLDKLTIDNPSSDWLSFEQKKAAFGAGGIVIKATDRYAHSLVVAPWVTFGALADYAIVSEKAFRSRTT